MESIFNALRFIPQLIVFAISVRTVTLVLSRGTTFQWGLSPHNQSPPQFLAKVWLLLGAAFGVYWSVVTFALNANLASQHSRVVVVLSFLVNYAGRIIIHLFLVTIFVFLAVSVGRSRHSLYIRLAAVSLSIAAIAANVIALYRHFGHRQ
jgi:hypothetical protein